MIIKIKVKPNSSQNKLEKTSSLIYQAQVKAPPEKGKANQELIKLLSRHFKVPSKNIKIKTPLSRTKVVEILT